MKNQIVERILEIVKFEGGQSMKNTMKWKDVKFKNKHISDLENDDFADAWITPSEIVNFFERVIRQYNKSF